MKIRYEAKDGKIFDNEQDCKKYETETAELVERLKSMIVELQNFCNDHYDVDDGSCGYCPLRNEGCPFRNEDDD